MRIRRRRLLGATALGLAASATRSLVIATPTFAITAGVVVTLAGRHDAAPFSGDNRAATEAGLGEPTALAVGSAAALYVAERVLEAKPQGARSILRSIDGTPARRISRVAGTGAKPYEVTAAGTWRRTQPMVQSRARDLAPSFINGLAVRGTTIYASLVDADGTGVVVGIDLRSGAVQVLAGGGANMTDDGPATEALLSSPAGLAVMAGGDLLVAEHDANRVRRITALGTIVTVAGGNPPRVSRRPQRVKKGDAISVQVSDVGDGGLATRAVVRGPHSMVVDAAGNVFVSESVGHRVRRIDPAGVIRTVAGTGTAGFAGDGGPAAAARLSRPQGLAADAAGNLFIADSFNHRVRLVSAGTISTFAGTGRVGYGGDGGPASAATFTRPSSLALTNGASELLVGDEGNRLVRAIAIA